MCRWVPYFSRISYVIFPAQWFWGVSPAFWWCLVRALGAYKIRVFCA